MLNAFIVEPTNVKAHLSTLTRQSREFKQKTLKRLSMKVLYHGYGSRISFIGNADL